jgi:hypothetical protein
MSDADAFVSVALTIGHFRQRLMESLLDGY